MINIHNSLAQHRSCHLFLQLAARGSQRREVLETLQASDIHSFVMKTKIKSIANSCRILDNLQDECTSDASSTGKINKFIHSMSNQTGTYQFNSISGSRNLP